VKYTSVTQTVLIKGQVTWWGSDHNYKGEFLYFHRIQSSEVFKVFYAAQIFLTKHSLLLWEAFSHAAINAHIYIIKYVCL